MNPLSRRASRAAAAAALSLVPASLLLVPIPDAVAVESTATVNFSDCEVHDRPYTIDQQVGGDTNWSPTVRLDHPSPLPSGDEVTVEAELGVLPAGTMPTSMTDLYLDVELEFTHTVPGPGPLRVFHSDFYFASFDKDAPLVIPEIEYQMSWSDPGLYDLRPKRVWLLFTAQDLGGNWVEYSFECDQVVNPQPLVTVPVYDLSATPELTLDRFTAQAGQSVGFAGRNLLAAAPMSPRVRATVTIAGNPAGTVEVDDSGAVHGNLSVPAGLSGTVEVRVTNGAKSAAAMLELSPPPGGGGVVGGVDVNNPATWHVNAQGGVVDGLAQVKVAAKTLRSGSKLKVGGSGFAPGEAVIIKAKGGKGKGAKLVTKVVYANAVGAIKAGLKLKRAAKGKWRVTAIGVASGRGGLARFKVR